MWGVATCQARIKVNNRPCTNKAYFRTPGGKHLCGTHVRSESRFTELPRPPPEWKAQERARQEEEVEKARMANVAMGRPGELRLSRMYMMKQPTHTPGFRNVYPNYKDQNRGDGFGCASLSPKSLGPVHHDQPGLPDACNLENFHQGTKCFSQEADADGNPTHVYYANRHAFYRDPVPHRHKFRSTDAQNPNIPLYFVWVDQDGQEHRLSYVESRQFYCHFYEQMVRGLADYKIICQMLADGYNLQICGYDARWPLEHDSFEEVYLNPARPFGTSWFYTAC